MNLSYSKINFFLVFLLFGCSEPAKRGINGTLTFSPLIVKQIYLYEKIGHQLFVIDSAAVDKQGRFSFLKSQYPIGYYQLVLNDSSKVDIILNPSETKVEFEFSDARLHHGIKVISSTENQVLWEYKLISKSIQYELKDVQDQLFHPDIDSISSLSLLNKQDSLRGYKLRELNRLCSSHPHSFFTKVVRASVFPKTGNPAEIKARFFENLNFSDAELVRSTVFPKFIMGYLKNHTELTEAGFCSSVDTILKHAGVNSEVFAFCLEYLLQIFDKAGPQAVFQYIVESHLVGDGCSEVDLSELMKGKSEAYARLMPGKTAPDISVSGVKGSSISLGRVVEAGKINLLFFWSSHCTYCKEALPQIKSMYEHHKDSGLQIIAVSLDESKEEWLNTIEDYDLDWIHLLEIKGWKSSIVKLYKIDRTPSYFLMDSEMKILAKPRSSEELKTSLALLK